MAAGARGCSTLHDDDFEIRLGSSDDATTGPTPA
jgi:hypothetical protein